MLFGLGGIRGFSAGNALALLLSAIVIVCVAYAFLRHRRDVDPLAWVLLTCAVLTSFGMLKTPYLFDHYAYFPFVFVALVFAISMSTIVGDVRRATSKGSYEGSLGQLAWQVAALLVVAFVGLLATSNILYAKRYLSEAWNPSAMIERTIPVGSCAVSDFPIDLLVADRYVATNSSCPVVVDPEGEYLAEDKGLSPNPTGPYPLAFRESWLGTLAKAGYVDMRIAYSDDFPWDTYSINYFAENYKLVGSAAVTFPDSLIDPRSLSLIYEDLHP
jgi:hypothetical protein